MTFLYDIRDNDGNQDSIFSLISAQTIFDLASNSINGYTGFAATNNASTNGGSNREIILPESYVYQYDTFSIISASTVALSANSSGNDRLDLIEIDSNGDWVIVEGTPSSTPREPTRTGDPDFPITNIKFGIVLVKDGDTSIPDSQIVSRGKYSLGRSGFFSGETVGTVGGPAARYITDDGIIHSKNIFSNTYNERISLTGGLFVAERHWDPETGPPISQMKPNTVILRRKY